MLADELNGEKTRGGQGWGRSDESFTSTATQRASQSNARDGEVQTSRVDCGDWSARVCRIVPVFDGMVLFYSVSFDFFLNGAST